MVIYIPFVSSVYIIIHIMQHFFTFMSISLHKSKFYYGGSHIGLPVSSLYDSGQ